MTTLLVALCAVLVALVGALCGLALWVLKAEARVQRLEAVVSQIGPAIASRINREIPTKVSVADQWYDEMEQPEDSWRS